MGKINEQKFLQLYDQYVTKIYRYIYFRVGSKQVAQDLSSETFLRTWQYLKEKGNIGNFSAMIYQVCRNLIADYFRKNPNFPITLDDVSEKELTDPGSDLTEQVGEKLEVAEIKEALKYLKVEYQEVIIWHYIDDFSIKEIAQITEKSEGSVRTSLSRAIKALKNTTSMEKTAPIDN